VEGENSRGVGLGHSLKAVQAVSQVRRVERVCKDWRQRDWDKCKGLEERQCHWSREVGDIGDFDST
jgi:hypothetical protein